MIDNFSRRFMLTSHLFLFLACLVFIIKFGQPAPQKPVLLGWALAALNFTAAVFINQIAMKKGLETLKLAVFGGMTIRIGLMLLVLYIVTRLKPEWMKLFSCSLLISFGIYTILEVVLFFVKEKQKTP